MKYNVYEMITDIKPIGYAEDIKPGEIHIKLKDKTLILLEKPKNQKNIKNGETTSDKCFENEITKQLKGDSKYQIEFKGEVIKELSQILNQHYQNIFSPNALKEKIKPILKQHGYKSNLRNASYAYIKYFIIDGLLEKNEKENVYVIIRNNVIPKKKKEHRGFLDELGM